MLLCYHTDLINDGLLWTTSENIFVFVLKSEQVSSWDVRVVLSLEPALGWVGGMLVDLELNDLLPRAVDAPLTKVIVSPDAVH